MITIFSEAAAGTSRSEMTNAQKFLNDQIANTKLSSKAADQRRADFRDKYRDILPDVANGGTRLEAARAAVRQLQLELRDATAKRDAVSHQLASVSQLLTVDQAASVIVTNGQPTGGSTQPISQRLSNNSISSLSMIQTSILMSSTSSANC